MTKHANVFFDKTEQEMAVVEKDSKITKDIFEEIMDLVKENYDALKEEVVKAN